MESCDSKLDPLIERILFTVGGQRKLSVSHGKDDKLEKVWRIEGFYPCKIP